MNRCYILWKALKSKITNKLVFVALCIFYIFLTLAGVVKNDWFYSQTTASAHSTIQSNDFYENNFWLYNEDIGQYSAYVVKNSSHTWIEAIISVKKTNASLKEFLCLVQIQGTSEIVEIKPTALQGRSYDRIPRRLVAALHIQDLDNRKLAVAIVRTNNSQDYVNFQKADLITINEPRKKAIAQCIKQVYSFGETQIRYLELQKKFGIGELFLHDATPNQTLTEFIKNNKEYANFMRIRQYITDKTIICDKSSVGLFGRKTLNETYINAFYKKCLSYMSERVNPEEICLNDCYVNLGYKYEFIAVLDLDEIVFPRSHTPYQQFSRINASCDAHNVCQTKPFDSSVYDYVRNIIRNRSDVNYTNSSSNLASINFPHVIMLTKDIVHKIMSSLKALSVTLASNASVSFPIVHDVNDTCSFKIKKSDVEYLNYLVELDEQVQCFISRIENSTSIPDEYKRYMYHVLPWRQRFGKSIHYTKNVGTLFAHWAYETRGITFTSNIARGQFHLHFRSRIKNWYSKKPEDRIVTSIRDLNIDAEYLAYTIKTYTRAC
jgi:hypothetical protein